MRCFVLSTLFIVNGKHLKMLMHFLCRALKVLKCGPNIVNSLPDFAVVKSA